MKRPGALLSAAGLALALGAAACSSGGAPSSSSGSGSAAPAGPVNRTFTYDTTAPVMDDGWDPATEYSDAIIAMSNMYETLTRYDSATHQVEPLLATSWSSSKNGLTWTFHLRQGVKFHTGRLMTAQAAKAAIERTIKLNGGAAYVWGAVKSIDAPGPDTLVFHLRYPSPLDLEASADYSAYIYDTKAAGSGSLTKWLNTPHDAGTGPYTVQTWNKGQEFEVTQTQFPGYWGGWKGSHFTKVVYRVVTQDTTSVQLLRSGQVSFVEQMAPALWDSLRGAPGVRLVSAASWQNLLGQLNAKALSLPERQAILYGINYNGIVAALKGAATLSSGLVPDGLFGHFGSSSLPNYRYDPAKAASLLNSIGYGPGKKPLNLSLTYTQGDSNEQVVATLMKSSLAKLNINLSIQSLAWPTQWGKAKSAQPGPAPGHLLRVLVAGLRRPVLVVRQPAGDREAAVLQPLLLLQPGAGQADQPGRDAGRHQPDGGPGAVQVDAGDDPPAGPAHGPVQRHLPVRDVVRVHRIHVQPGLPERRLRA